MPSTRAPRHARSPEWFENAASTSLRRVQDGERCRTTQGREPVAGLTTLSPSKGRSNRRVAVGLGGSLALQPVVAPAGWMKGVLLHERAHAVKGAKVEKKIFGKAAGRFSGFPCRQQLLAAPCLSRFAFFPSPVTRMACPVLALPCPLPPRKS